MPKRVTNAPTAGAASEKSQSLAHHQSSGRVRSWSITMQLESADGRCAPGPLTALRDPVKMSLPQNSVCTQVMRYRGILKYHPAQVDTVLKRKNSRNFKMQMCAF